MMKQLGKGGRMPGMPQLLGQNGRR
jgi:hypothetical protein